MLHIEEISENQLSEAAVLEKEIFTDAWSEKSLLDTWRQPGTIIFGAWSEGILAGYVIVYYVLDEAEIMRIAVKEAFRRQGAASQLLLKVGEFCAAENIDSIFGGAGK